MNETKFTIENLLEHHLNNDTELAYSATLVSKDTGKSINVELSENAQGIVAYNRRTDMLW